MNKANIFMKKYLHFMRFALIALLFLSLTASTFAVVYESEFTTLAELQEKARALNAEVTADSVTLLKNIGNSLPLAKGDKVTVFGVFSDQNGTSSNTGFAFGGQGSGQGSDPLGYVSLHSGLEMAGINVNPTVKAYYASSAHGGIAYSRAATVSNSATDTSLRGLPTGWSPRNNSYSVGEEVPDGPDGNGNLETVKTSFTDYSDAAVIVIRRTGTEGGDYSLFNTPGHSNPLDHYYQADDNELALIDYADRYFDNVIVLINSANAMQLTDIEDNEKVDSILWIGYPGGSGNIGVGKVIAGEVSPSGRTVDLYNADIKTDPAWQNFAGNIQTHLRVEEREMIEQIGSNNWVKHTILVAVTKEDPWSFNSQGMVTLKDPLTLKDIVPTDGTNGTMGYRGRPVVEQYSRITDMNGTLNMPQAVTYSGDSSMSNLLDYEEGIYVGYRFYETAYHEGYFDGTGEIEGGQFEREEAGYYNRTDGVLYPFGYGLSYTSFNQEFVNKSTFQGLALDTADASKMEIQVRVTNTGLAEGKETVQLYLTAPYTPGGIEKSYVSLVAFGKTGTIKPGQSETITLSVNVQDLASFDWNDANDDGHKGYELDPGTYTFRLQKNSHEEIENFQMTLAAIKHYDKDAVTGADVKPLFSPEDGEWDGTRDDLDYYSTFRNEFVTPESSMVLMTRADFEGTFPISPTEDDLKFSPEAIRIMDSQAAYTAFNDLTSDPWYIAEDDVPETWTQASADQVAARVNGKTAVQLWEMADVAYDDPRWDEFINQLTWAEIQTLINNSAQNAVSSIGRPQSANADGPGAFPNSQNGGSGGGIGTHWCAAANIAATFDVANAEKVGRMEGEHSLWNGAQGWYGPGLQMHRISTSGRNFEYFSQDPLLTGLMGAYQVKGATSTGTIVYMKHLFLNEQETSRYTLHTFADEQTAREIYIRAFEWAIKFGNANSTMSAYPSSGLVHPTANYYLYEKLLHDEWGFKGYSITDYFNNDNTLTTANMSTRANQVPLNSWQTNFGRNMDGVWDETKNVLVVTMPEATSYDPQNVNGGASRAYKDQVTGEIASKVYFSDEEALADGFIPFVAGDSIDAYTQWAAYRNLAHRILYTTVNSNVMKNGLVASPWSSTSTGTVYAPIGLDSNASVAGDQTLAGFDVKYTLKSGTIPSGLTLNADGSITGKATTAGTYRITVGAYLADTNWVGMGGGNNTYQRNYDIKVEPLVSYEGDKNLIVGVPFTGTYIVNPNFLPLPAGSWVAAFRTSPGTSWITHSSSALPAGITLTQIGSSFSDPTSPDYGRITISGTPTAPIENRTVYFYLGIASFGSYIGTVYGSDVLSFTVAGNYIFDLNYLDSVDETLTFIPNQKLVISNPSRDGYIFSGWYSDELCTTLAIMTATTQANTTLYAGWVDINDSQAALEVLSRQVAELYDEQIADQQELADKVLAFQTQINDVLARLTTAEASIVNIPSIQASIALIEESLVALTGDVNAEFESLTESLDLQFEAIEAKFEDATEALAAARLALEAEIISGNEASAAALVVAIDTLELALEAGDEVLTDALADSVTSLTALIATANQRIDVQEIDLAALEAELAAAKLEFLAAAARLQTAEGAIDSSEAKIDTLEAELDALQLALDAAKAEIAKLVEASEVVPDTGCGSALQSGSALFVLFSLILGTVLVVFLKRRR